MKSILCLKLFIECVMQQSKIKNVAEHLKRFGTITGRDIIDKFMLNDCYGSVKKLKRSPYNLDIHSKMLTGNNGIRYAQYNLYREKILR